MWAGQETSPHRALTNGWPFGSQAFGLCGGAGGDMGIC